MDIIHLLPDSVANQIAAGEVIQRPASVIKELMENAVDAGAMNVDVLVVDAGRTSIQVIDDGKGMSETDARLAFERHATSKILKAEDLFSLHTMGFRGEALPSIAAVAQVRLTTRTPDHELGTVLTIEGSRVVSQEPCSCPVGANFEVRNLFFNVPARRKFLKSNQTELNNIIQEFERIVLVNPSVSFTLTHNGVLVTKLPASSQRQRIINVFGKRLNEQLLSVDVDTSLVHLSGYVGKPDSARKKGVYQYFFVNGRYMRHSYFHKAVMEAYEQLIPQGEQIPYFLYFQVAPSCIDVNIHPTKTEIKFENEAAIWQIVIAAIREALGRFNAVPTIDFDVEGRPDIPAFGKEPSPSGTSSPRVEVNTSFNPFTTHSDAGSYSRVPVDWDKLYAGVVKAGQGVRREGEIMGETIQASPEPSMQNLYEGQPGQFPLDGVEYFQFKGQYILSSSYSGIMVIDQHRAHVRILYDRYRAQMEGKPVSSQGLLFPEVIQYSISDAMLLEELTDEIRALGFDIVPLGQGSFSLNGVPIGLDGLDPKRVLTNMVESAKETPSGIENEIQHRLALALARSASIPVGRVLTQQEISDLVESLFACKESVYGPDGKPIIAILHQEVIDKLFN
ncbi:MAG: DNA mismatch repair endonuclease MutL [Bacteroidaceae bacterium]|nr:DNA mismatch repair endonuclease MutL [Bacteroidaceae bacterium]